MKLFSKKKEKNTPIPLNCNLERTLEINPGESIIFAFDTHIGTREYQQDALYACALGKKGYAGVLCDGMGGMENGSEAAEKVVEYIVNRLNEMPTEVDIQSYLTEAAQDANKLVTSGSGTTLVCAVILKDSLNWVSVGDSRIYIIRGEEIVQITTDHTYELKLSERVKAGKLSAEKAMSDPQRQSLVSYLGAPYLEYIDTNHKPFKLIYGDIVLLCSDGLTRSLSDRAILDIIRQYGSNLKEASRVLPLSAFDASPAAQDNTSVILMQYIKKSEESV